MQGKLFADNVCIASSTNCANDFTFYGITSQKGLDLADGILGLAPESSNNGPSFVKLLKDQKIIDKKMFSFYLTFD